MTEFPISQGDWMAQKATIIARIELLRDELELPSGQESIDNQRGQIEALRWIISLAEPTYIESSVAKYT